MTTKMKVVLLVVCGGRMSLICVLLGLVVSVFFVSWKPFSWVEVMIRFDGWTSSNRMFSSVIVYFCWRRLVV